MSKWLRREAAKQCPVHQAVTDEASQGLQDFGVFEKREVLTRLNLLAMADAIRWDYIREFLQDEQGCELVPLAAAYFKRHQLSEERVNPEKFIATGHGKKTMGYAAVLPENDHLVVARIRHRKALANGVGKAFQLYITKVNERRTAAISDSRVSPMVANSSDS